jgi:formylmethanofuran--tetrahydromethanopterin N-formyltransferase
LPLLKDKIENTEIPADVNSVYEIVINGLDEKALKLPWEQELNAL